MAAADVYMDSAGFSPCGTRATNITMAWALLLYVLVLSVAFLGKVKPF